MHSVHTNAHEKHARDYYIHTHAHRHACMQMELGQEETGVFNSFQVHLLLRILKTFLLLQHEL